MKTISIICLVALCGCDPNHDSMPAKDMAKAIKECHNAGLDYVARAYVLDGAIANIMCIPPEKK